MQKFANTCLVLMLVMGTTACSTMSRLSALPDETVLHSSVLNIPDVRFWEKPEDPTFVKIVNDAISRALLNNSEAITDVDRDSMLVLSSGSDGGAFGAGILNGWTDRGDRPEFSMVTGISTGALIAPFAFVGSEYDDTIRDIYTTTSPKDIHRPRGLLRSLVSDAYSDTTPLGKQISQRMDKKLLKRVAQEYQRGRLLLIGTTNLDAREPVIWNMGAIAQSAHPEAPALFHNIVLASASVPGLFPPVMIESEVSGVKYQEMHVDGGTTGQVFSYPAWVNQWSFDQRYDDLFENSKTSIYVIRNSKLKPTWTQVDRRTAHIGFSAIRMLTHTLGSRDVDRIYYQSARDDIDFNLAMIGPSFQARHPEDFDRDYMNALYQYGYQQAVQGYPWQKKPPGLSSPDSEQAR